MPLTSFFAPAALRRRASEPHARNNGGKHGKDPCSTVPARRKAPAEHPIIEGRQKVPVYHGFDLSQAGRAGQGLKHVPRRVMLAG